MLPRQHDGPSFRATFIRGSLLTRRAKRFAIDSPRTSASQNEENLLSKQVIKQTSVDLSDAPGVLFLFGLAGAGKNFVGDIIGDLSSRYVYHADSDITPAMRDAISNKKAFTDQIRDEFFGVITSRIDELAREHGTLIVTQAVYKQRHRDLVAQRVSGVQFVHIVASEANILSRLYKRGDAITPEYAERMRAHFEEPPIDWPVIYNDGSREDVIRQAASLFPTRT